MLFLRQGRIKYQRSTVPGHFGDGHTGFSAHARKRNKGLWVAPHDERSAHHVVPLGEIALWLKEP